MKQVTGNTALVSPDDIVDVPAHIWRRLPDESYTAYAYFKFFLQSPAPRQLKRITRQLRMSTGSLGEYSARHRWFDRAEAYDIFIFDKENKKRKLLHEKRQQEWLERIEEQREQEWQIAQALLDKVREMLNVPLMRQTVTERLKEIDPDGKIVVEMIIVNEPVDWSAVDITRFFDVAAKMARLATGMDTERKRLTIDVAALTDEELEALANRK